MTVDGFVKYDIMVSRLFVLLVVSSSRCNFIINSDSQPVSLDV